MSKIKGFGDLKDKDDGKDKKHNEFYTGGNNAQGGGSGMAGTYLKYTTCKSYIARYMCTFDVATERLICGSGSADVLIERSLEELFFLPKLFTLNLRVFFILCHYFIYPF